MIIAIDPGLNGGIAWQMNEKVCAIRMPYTPKGIIEYLWDIRTAWDEDKENPTPCYSVCYLEKVNAMPNQGVSSVWTFAEHYGTLRGILITLGIPIVDVQPKAWQKAIGATRPPTPKGASQATKARIKAEGKHKIKQIVEARYPHLKITLATADALGILMFAEKEERK